MTVSVFPQSLKVARTNKLENITLRGFGGGWNAIETDLQMESSYLVKLRNFRRTAGGTQRIRFGSQFRAFWNDVVPETAVLLDMEYFSFTIVHVFSNGDIFGLDSDGTKVPIWSQAIAAALPDPADGWSDGLTT